MYIYKKSYEQITPKFKSLLFSTIFVFTSLFLHAQERGILLKNNSNQRTILLKENARIKVQTILGAKLVGNYTIIDDKTILLQGQNITLESIFSIRSCSVGSQAIKPLLVIGGVLIILVSAVSAIGLAGVHGSSGAAPTFLLGTLAGTTMIRGCLFSNNHYRQKWEYTIVTGK